MAFGGGGLALGGDTFNLALASCRNSTGIMGFFKKLSFIGIYRVKNIYRLKNDMASFASKDHEGWGGVQMKQEGKEVDKF